MNLFARKPERRRRITLTDIPVATAAAQTPHDPAEQVELICQAVEKLEQVHLLVRHLPELPVGDRRELMEQLVSTRESLRALYFLDAVY